jgi:hypothetical protein
MALLAALLFGVAGCASKVPNRSPLGEPLPVVVGESLDGVKVTLPDDLRGKPAILLLGYAQQAQFDADRWIMGLLQAKATVRILEVPTIPGMIPGMFAGMIDGGMRAGIPSEDWGSVVTLYGSDASKLVALTGNAGGPNMRVLLVDGDGRVRWFHDRGYSAGKCLELVDAARTLVPRS